MRAYNVTNRYENTLTYTITMPVDEEEYYLYKNKRKFKLTGKSISLRGTETYTTTNELEIEFLRTLSAVKITELDSEAKEESIQMGPAPVVGKVITDEEAAQFKYKDISEEIILKNLIRLGYIKENDKSGILKYIESGKVKELSEQVMVDRLKELGWTLYKKSHLSGKNKTKKK